MGASTLTGFLKDYSAVRAASFTQTRLCTGLKKTAFAGVEVRELSNIELLSPLLCCAREAHFYPW